MNLKQLKALILLLVLIACTNVLQAQHIIKGVVVEKTKKDKLVPIQLATVYWANSTINTYTDSNGIFRIPHTEEHKYLVVSFIGYQSDTIEITPQNMNNIQVVLKTEATLKLSEVEVTAETKSMTIDRLSGIKANIMTEKELFKAACCNLSESFETNPAIDVTYSDAVTGTKQIQMLGLAGNYTLITAENLPAVRGLASSYGLGYLPGSWIESIQVTKGIGSVANGYESITGQINVELRKPEGKDRVFANVYANQQGRYEANLVVTQKVNSKWSTALLMHSSTRNQKLDQNKDGFVDMPTGYQHNIINRWKYSNGKGLEGQIGVKALVENRIGGSTKYNGESQTESILNNAYGVNIATERFEVFGKTGYVFPQEKYKSIGFMWSALTHKQNSFFGESAINSREQSVYANLIFQSIIGNTHHKYRTGFSFLHDIYSEQISSPNLNFSGNVGRVENVPGAFFEYTWTVNDKWLVIGGLRGDYHNLFGFFATPRINARYDRGDGTVLHFTAGRGQRTANIFAENMQLLVTSRQFVLPANWQTQSAYGLQPEVAWNMGVSLTTDVKIGRRYATLEADLFSTQFQNQVVVDLDNSARQVSMYNLKGKSFANSAQLQISYEPIRRLETRIAYRYYDVRTQYQSGTLQRYLLSPHRAFINVAYKTRKKWVFDVTLNWFGPKRLPTTEDNPEDLQLGKKSPGFAMVNAQITKSIGKKWEVYTGIENAFDFRQTRLIVDPSNPFGSNFDASIVWGPVQGRMIYVGARFRIKN